jgi:hypothetical protein
MEYCRLLFLVDQYLDTVAVSVKVEDERVGMERMIFPL